MSASYIAIIQSRMGSTRLPGKALLKVAGKTVLEHVVRRIQAAKGVTDIIVATTVAKADLAIVKWCALHNVSVFCGSENDVLDRYYQAARLFGAQNIIRITSDCPVIDPQLIDKMIRFYKNKKVDYAANIVEETFPDGEDIEIFTFGTLEAAWKQATLPSEREHVTPYIRKYPKIFSLANYKSKENLAHSRWTLDEPKDFHFIKEIYKRLYHRNKLFGMNAIIQLLKLHPQLQSINTAIIRNSGYKKSLKEDMIFLQKEKNGKRTKTI